MAIVAASETARGARPPQTRPLNVQLMQPSCREDSPQQGHSFDSPGPRCRSSMRKGLACLQQEVPAPRDVKLARLVTARAFGIARKESGMPMRWRVPPGAVLNRMFSAHADRPSPDDRRDATGCRRRAQLQRDHVVAGRSLLHNMAINSPGTVEDGIIAEQFSVCSTSQSAARRLPHVDIRATFCKGMVVP